MLFIPYRRPSLSGGGDPEAFVSASTLHVGDSGSGLVTGQLVVALVTGVGTPAMRPTVVTRRSRRTSRVGAIVGASATPATIVARVAWVARGSVRTATAEQSHHFGHLREKSSFTRSNRQFTLLERGVGKVSGRKGDQGSGRGGIFSGRYGVEEMLGNEVGHGCDTIDLVPLSVVKITGHGKRAEVTLGIAKMLNHVGPGAFNGRATVPKAKILLKDGLASQDDIGEVNHLLERHGRKGVLGKIGEIVNRVEDHVDGLGYVVGHAENCHFLGLDLLGRDFAMSGKKMHQNSTDVIGVLSGGAIEKSAKVDRVDGGDDLRNERLLCGLTEVELEFEFAPNIFGRFDLGGSAGRRGNEWAWVDGSNPGDCVG